MTSQPPIRIGNQERESARRALDEHLAEGRLDLDEYADRYAKAALARYQGELDELFVDLPRPHATAAPTVTLEKSAAPPRRPSRRPRELTRLLRVALVVAVVAVAVPAFSAWWVFWFVVPMLLWGGPFRLGPCGRSHHYARRERVSASRP